MGTSSANRRKRIGHRLRAARRRAGLTQVAAAATLGVTQRAVSNWETGDRLPARPRHAALAQLYDVAETDLFNGDPLSSSERLK